MGACTSAFALLRLRVSRAAVESSPANTVVILETTLPIFVLVAVFCEHLLLARGVKGLSIAVAAGAS